MDGCEGWEFVDVLFVSPGYISIEIRVQGHCSGRANSYHRLSTSKLSDYAERWSIDFPSLSAQSVFGSAGLGAFRDAAQAECIRWTAMGPYDGAIPMPACHDELVRSPFYNWAVKRAGDDWRVVGRIQGWRANFTDYILPLELSAAVSASAAPALDGRTTALLPSARDILQSPDGTFAAVITDAEISFHLQPGSELGELGLTVPLESRERVVLIAWAVGTDVRRWTDQLLDRFAALSGAPK